MNWRAAHVQGGILMSVRRGIAKKYFHVCLILFSSFLACKKSPSTQPVVQGPLELWRSLSLHDYTVDQRRWCFCPHAGETVRIGVRSDTIAGIMRLSDTTAVTYPFFLPVDSLFAIIDRSTTDSLVVRYNAQYGYPEFLDVNPQAHAYDGGYTVETMNLQIPGGLLHGD